MRCMYWIGLEDVNAKCQEEVKIAYFKGGWEVVFEL
jgi:hypothetical protein